ncbi:hypothetical protein Cgig2_032307 [Carnegiea gigantea]|uniref:DUF4283 domain-containing protein n=1 Tax=Carnegiea gigantea TaxID=171969 RepID=A0A9Q1JUM4_9CARY|nr:hypothetical protein Cgig2_032307 [Carnegiea gigantea]
MARGGRKGRAKQARDPVSPRIPVAAQEGTIDLDSTSKGESSNATLPVTTEVSEIEPLRVPSPNTYDAAFQSNTIKSSYAAMADPDEGTSLNFVHSLMVNGVKCAKIEPQDVQSEVDCWKSAVLCSVIGANPPLEVLNGFVRRIWQACEIDKVCLVRKGVFLVRFQNLNDQFTVVQRGVYFFDNKPFIVKPWSEDMDLNTEDLVSLPVWGPESLSKLGSMLGVPIKRDKFTRDKAFLRYARLLIEMQLQDSFPDFIDFVNEHNVVVRQKVEYEWKPSKCTFCKMFGHIDEECRKKPLPRAEWRPITRQNPPPSSSALAQPSTDAEGFVQTICSWNIRGLNWPNKQEDVRLFLQEKQIGLVGLLETKVKEDKASKIANNIFQGTYSVQILSQSVQFIHCKATQNNTMKNFFITFVYGANHEAQRGPLWEDLIHIAQEMDEAWCILGDFNAVLYPGDRIGGTEVQFHEIKNFSDCISTCEVQELKSNGPCYT